MDTLYHKTWVVRSAASCVVATSRAVARERLKEGHAKDSRQKQIGEARSSERIGLQCSVVLASGFLLGWKRRIALASTTLSPCRWIHGQQLTTSSGLGKMPITVFRSHRELSL